MISTTMPVGQVFGPSRSINSERTAVKSPVFHAGICLLAASAASLLFAQAPLQDQDPRSPEIADRISQFNQALTTAVSQPANSGLISDLVSQRASLFLRLLATDPVRALALTLPQEIADRLRAAAPAGAVESRGEWQGRIEATIADDFTNHRSHTRWYLSTAGGRIEMFFGNQQEPRLGDPARIRGVRMGDRVAVESIMAGGQMIVAGDPLPAGTQAACTTTGPQNIAVLMLTMPSNQTFPSGYTQASLREAFFGSSSDTNNTDSLNGFWQEMSYGQASATGQVFGPFALGQDYTCDQIGSIAAAAINAADSAVDFTQFTRTALVFPVPSCASYSGESTLGCQSISSPSKGNLMASTSWLPVFPNASTPPVGLYAHELGHGLGLAHSSTDDYSNVPLGPPNVPGTTVEYGDPFSLMGYPYNGSGYTSGQYPGEYKSILHWLNPGSGYQEVASSGTFTLKPFESSADPRALRVLRDPTTSAWLWLEYRQPLGDVDSNLQYLANSNVFNGALIHYEDPALDSLHTYLLDFNPVSRPNSFNNAALAAGSSWSDPYSLLTLSTSNATASGLSVKVNYDSPCAALQFSSTVFPSAANSGWVTVTAPPTCSWTASTGAGWIHLNGLTSGAGNGTVTFAVDANSGAAQRNGYITVQRQSTPVVQTGSSISILSVSSSFGSGTTGQFTFQLRDESGYGDIGELWARFQGSPECQVYVYLYVYPAGVELISDSGSWLGPISLGVPGQTLSNSICSVSSSGSSFTGSGNQLQVTLQMNFFAAFAGAHRITGESWSNASGAGTGQVPLGTWVVPAVQPPAVTIAKTHTGSFTQGQTGATYAVTVSNSASAGPTSGTVTVTEAPPAGLTLVSMTGAGWTCPAGGATCTRSDALAAGSSYPAITVTVNVSASATSPQVNTIALSGGGAPVAYAADPTVVTAVAISGPPSLPAGQVGVAYAATTVTATGGSGSYAWSATGLPAGLGIGSATGIISGTPTTNSGSPYTVLVTVTDSNSAKATRTYSLTINAAPVNLPQITGVSNAASGQVAIAPNTWVSIYGANFTAAGFSDDWSKSIVSGTLPTILDGVSVSVGGIPAYVSYVSPGQINILTPNVAAGSAPVTVTAASATTAPVNVTSQQFSPAFFPWPNGQPVATHLDYSWAVKNGTFAGATTVPAKPGEYIILWGTGFGPTTPTAPTGVTVPATTTYNTANAVSVTIGSATAAVYGTALASGFAGLYQVVVTVPAALSNGDYPLVATVGGVATATTTLTVHN